MLSVFGSTAVLLFFEVFMKRYITKHINQNKYVGTPSLSDFAFQSYDGWYDYLISEEMVYSHRRTDYSGKKCDETAHIHDYYELVIYVSGEVDYVTEGSVFSPAPVAAALFAPGTVHNTRLSSPSVYERYVFYFYPQLFQHNGMPFPFSGLLSSSSGAEVTLLPREETDVLIHALRRIDSEASLSEPNKLRVYVRAMNALDLIAELISKGHATGESLPPKMLEIKSYIDENYAEIESVSDVAKNFFYSREYVSRLFKKYYSVSVSDYLARVRVIRSIEMMQGGVSVTDACFAVGFGSMSAFYLTFRKIMGMSPSEYAKRQRENTNK